MSDTNHDDSIGVRPAQIIPTHYGMLSHVITPGTPPGKSQPFCPIRPQGDWPHTDAQIAEWVREVIMLGKAKGLLYMPEAVRYFATNCYWPLKNFSDITRYQHLRVRKLAYELAVREHRNGVGASGNKFVDDAPEGI